jgi:ribonuclease P protein component
MDNKFPTERRVCKKSDFIPVLRTGSPFFSRHGKLLCKSNLYCYPRFGMIVSKKAAKRSVTRSRIKRVARETFRQNQSGLPNQDMVFIAHYGSDEVTNEELRKCIKRMLTQLQKSVSSS